MEPMNPQAGSTARARKAAWVWIVVGFAIVLAALAWYYYSSYVPPAVLPAGEDAATRALERQGTSDAVEAIEADLGATDLEGLDRELSDIDRELTP